jgi:hypothetical protein
VQLPHIIPVDFALMLLEKVSQDDLNNLVNFKLYSWLALYGLPSKNDCDYVDLQKRLATPRTNIADLVDYCV